MTPKEFPASLEEAGISSLAEAVGKTIVIEHSKAHHSGEDESEVVTSFLVQATRGFTYTRNQAQPGEYAAMFIVPPIGILEDEFEVRHVTWTSAKGWVVMLMRKSGAWQSAPVHWIKEITKVKFI